MRPLPSSPATRPHPARWASREATRPSHATRAAPADDAAPSTSFSAANSQPTPPPQPPHQAPPFYISSDGRRKAVVEDAAPGSLTTSTAAAPWELGFQLSERTDFLWNDGLKTRLVVRAAGTEAGLSDEEMGDRLRRLAVLLPALGPRIPTLDPKLLARMGTQLEKVAAVVVALKAELPGVDVAALVTAEPRLALEARPAALGEAARELAALLPPGTDVAGLISAFPAYLDVAGVKAALAEAARVAPAFDLAGRIAAGEAAALFRFQARGLLIPYDQFSSDGSQTW
jgi:hypothetical protein